MELCGELMHLQHNCQGWHHKAAYVPGVELEFQMKIPLSISDCM
jgi:hypothetical protein